MTLMHHAVNSEDVTIKKIIKGILYKLRGDELMVRTGGLTDVGKVREVNEDSFVATDYFALVSDGMGGHNRGDVASKMIAVALADRITEKTAKEDIIDAVVEVNDLVSKESLSNPEFSGMGATLVMACWKDYDVLVANVGDSRCYHISGEEITQITKDHSLVQRLIDSGEITKEEAVSSNKKHIIYRAIGSDKREEPDMFEVKVSKNDAVLLCSDGLSNMVTDDKILEIVKSGDNPEKISKKLIEEANKNGGADNITAVVVLFD